MIERTEFKANLIDINTIEVMIPMSYNSNGCLKFYLYQKGFLIKELHIKNHQENSKYHFYYLDQLPFLDLGNEYEIWDERNIRIKLNCSILCLQDKYVDRIHFDGDLGAIYSKNKTIFRVFSPLAYTCSVIAFRPYDDKSTVSRVMTKDKETGIFEVTIDGDLDGFFYYYIVRVNGKYHNVVDPYAKSLSLNSIYGVVVNDKKTEIDLHDNDLPPLRDICDSIIYELSVRDISSDKSAPFKYKGKYLGLTEEGLVTKNNNPIGIDYIKSLGVTHVQILPFYDFATTSDEHPEDTYNWGYDPLNYNAPEGSYATELFNPYNRIIEAKKMVASFHKHGIRVVMDVVYNHVFNLDASNFEKICPHYYFRFNEDGTPSNGSFCGNEFESRHLMARKFIVDSCLHYVKDYGIDGFRFDLMGLIDIKTIQEIYDECRKIKPDFIIYGEGWDMPTVMPGNQKASMYNAKKLPSIGFFNDRYRDIVKGKSDHSALYMRGYLTGDINYRDGFKHAFVGCTLPIAFPPLFDSPTQSINYVECHDNNTLYDKLKVCCYDDSEEDILKHLKLVNAVNVLSFGVAFFHAGQEIGLSKNGDHNSYRSGDEINSFKWNLVDEREHLYKYFKELIELKKTYPFLRLNNKDDIEKLISFKDEENGCLSIIYHDEKLISPLEDFRIIINPTKTKIEIALDDYYKVIFNESGKITSDCFAQYLSVNSLSLVVVVKTK